MSKKIPWHEDETFWTETMPILFPENRVQEAAAGIDQLLTLANLPAGAAVLDLCCGIGRHSLELARRGFRVTGVDRTQIYLERAAAAAKQEDLQLELIREDMRKFRRDESYNAVINLSTLAFHGMPFQRVFGHSSIEQLEKHFFVLLGDKRIGMLGKDAA